MYHIAYFLREIFKDSYKEATNKSLRLGPRGCHALVRRGKRNNFKKVLQFSVVNISLCYITYGIRAEDKQKDFLAPLLPLLPCGILVVG